MNDGTESSSDLSPVKLISKIGELADQIQSGLQSSSISLHPDLKTKISDLSRDLNQLSQAIKDREEEYNNLLALADISQYVNSSLEINEVLKIVMDTIIRISDAERGFLMLRDQSGELQFRIARNWEQESIHPSEFAISRTVVNRVANEGQAVLTTNAQEDPRFGGQESIIAYSLRSILCVPLKVKDEITGVIYTDNRIRAGIFTEAERDLLEKFANQAAIAIENARLFESVRQTLAEVTQLKNLMDNVFASIASGVITADIEDKVMLFNRAAERILGQPQEEVVGKTLDTIISPIVSQLTEDLTKVRFSNEQIVGKEFAVSLPKRGSTYLSLNLSPLKDATQNTQGVTIVMDDLTEKKRLEAQRKLFERMVSPAVIDQLDPEKLQLGGKRTEITTLFADIRGFTSFSESINPEQLVTILNRYLAAAADAVLIERGTIDKYEGDAIMAWFNAPIPQPDHPLRAVRSALGLREAVQELHQEFDPKYRLSFSVGIHLGDAVLGLVGTETRMEYTAIGDSVNTAKRIQENASENQILISAPVYALVENDIIVQEADPIRAKGKSELVQVYEVIDLK